MLLIIYFSFSAIRQLNKHETANESLLTVNEANSNSCAEASIKSLFYDDEGIRQNIQMPINDNVRVVGLAMLTFKMSGDRKKVVFFC